MMQPPTTAARKVLFGRHPSECENLCWCGGRSLPRRGGDRRQCLFNKFGALAWASRRRVPLQVEPTAFHAHSYAFRGCGGEKVPGPERSDIGRI